MIFFDNTRIICLLLSVARIYSNLFITKSQIQQFCDKYNLKFVHVNDLCSRLKESKVASEYDIIILNFII